MVINPIGFPNGIDNPSTIMRIDMPSSSFASVKIARKRNRSWNQIDWCVVCSVRVEAASHTTAQIGEGRPIARDCTLGIETSGKIDNPARGIRYCISVP